MKKSLPIFIFVLLFSFSIKAQESTTFSNTDNSSEITKTSFFEWNFGVAFLSYDSLIPFPGGSALWGTTFINKEKILEKFKVTKCEFDKNIVFTCGSGVTASVLALAYFLIDNKYMPTIYDGSWSEYGKN
mgnify:CR=1 FL=1